MNDISLARPTVGLSSIGWSDDTTNARRATNSEYTPIGGKIFHSLDSLYEVKTVSDLARGVTNVEHIDKQLLQPQRFEAALYDVFDKVNDPVHMSEKSEAALSTLNRIKGAWEQCRDNIAMLNLA